MNLSTYDRGVKEIMNDKEYLYSTMTRDVYYSGKVLAGKYRYRLLLFCKLILI